MAADTVASFALICAAIMPVLWVNFTENRYVHLGLFALSLGFFASAIYTVKYLVIATYPEVGAVIDYIFWILILVSFGLILWAFYNLGRGLLDHALALYDRGRKWRGKRNQSISDQT